MGKRNFKTEQENFWYGDFGNDYVARNQGAGLLASNLHFFSKILQHFNTVESILEFGCNIGMNLKALQLLLPKAALWGIEINESACERLKELGNINIINDSIINYQPNIKIDFVFTKGVLIHLNPDELANVYQKLYDSSNCYICIAEYYNPVPIAIDYRGNKNKLFKRDFAGEFMKSFPDVELIEYGFCYHNDNNFPQDDITWFLLRKG